LASTTFSLKFPAKYNFIPMSVEIRLSRNYSFSTP
jgi:hypothetical protein